MKTLLLGLLLCASTAQAADSLRRDTTYWQRSFGAALNFNQASFNNWAGVNSIALQAGVDFRALYRKERLQWENTANLLLGYTRLGGSLRKTGDNLFVNSALGYQLAPKWQAVLSANFVSFFAPGFVYGTDAQGRETKAKNQNFLAPGHLTLALGIGYAPTAWLKTTLSPFAPSVTFVADEEVRPRDPLTGQRLAAYEVQPGRTSHTKWAALQWQVAIDKKLSDKIALTSLYQLNADYQKLSSDEWRHFFRLALQAEISKYIKAQLGFTAVYNKYTPLPLDGSKWQIQQTLGIGFLYTASTFKK